MHAHTSNLTNSGKQIRFQFGFTLSYLISLFYQQERPIKHTCNKWNLKKNVSIRRSLYIPTPFKYKCFTVQNEKLLLQLTNIQRIPVHVYTQVNN